MAKYGKPEIIYSDQVFQFVASARMSAMTGAGIKSSTDGLADRSILSLSMGCDDRSNRRFSISVSCRTASKPKRAIKSWIEICIFERYQIVRNSSLSGLRNAVSNGR